MNIREETGRVKDGIHSAYRRCCALDSIVTVGGEATPQYCSEMEKLLGNLESVTMQARLLGEACYQDIQPMEKSLDDYDAHWAEDTPAGQIAVDENGWLHITLHTLLPHCKHKSSPILRDTIVRLLRGYKQKHSYLPTYARALLVIEEHCNQTTRKVFDQDNKSWKAIPNALKGLVVEDDDQFHLGITLVSVWDDIPSCHLRVMELEDAGTYFALYHGDSGSYFRR